MAVWAEKSRCAAKQRRDREQEELNKLMEVLPFPMSTLMQLDKAAILKLAVCYLQMKEFTKQDGDSMLEEFQNRQLVSDNYIVDPAYDGYHSTAMDISSACQHLLPVESYQMPATTDMQVNEGKLMLNALDGLVMVVDGNGSILYISENAHRITGFRQVKMIGQSAVNFIHPDDHREFVKQFCFMKPQQKHPVQPCFQDQPMDIGNDGEIDEAQLVQRRSFYIRMKCFLRHRGTKTRQFGHILTQWSGKLRLVWEDGRYRIAGMIATVRPIHSVPLLEVRLEDDVFISRHALDMSFTFCDPRILNLAGYEPSEVIGKTAYQFHNPLDAPKIHHCHQNLIAKGMSVSRSYRFLSKLGQWIWMKTRATIITDTNNQPQYVVCQNFVYSDEEGRKNQQTENGGSIDLDVSPLSPYSSSCPASPSSSCNSSNNNNTEQAASSSSAQNEDSHDSFTSASLPTCSATDIGGDILPLDATPPISAINMAPMVPAFMSNVDMLPALTDNVDCVDGSLASFSVSDLPHMLDSLPDDLVTPLDVLPSMLPSPSSSSGYESEMNDGTNSSESSRTSAAAAVTSPLSPLGSAGLRHDFTLFQTSNADENPRSPSTSLSSMLDSDDCLSPPVWNTGVNQQTDLLFNQANNSLRDHSYMAPPQRPQCDFTITPSTMPLISGEFDPVGLSLDTNIEFDWLDEVSESLMNSQSSLLSWQDDFSTSGSSLMSNTNILGDSGVSSQLSDSLSHARACYRSVASDHDYSAKPTDEPVSVKAAIPAAYSDNFSDSMNDLDLLSDSHLGSSYNMADVSGYQRTSTKSLARPAPHTASSQKTLHSAARSDTILGALLGSNSKAAAYKKRSTNPIVSRSNCMPARRSISSSMSVGMFPSDVLGHQTTCNGSISKSTQEFAYKFAENMAEQQMRLQMLSYLAGDEVDSDELDLRSCLRPSRKEATVTCLVAPSTSQQSARTLGFTGRQTKQASHVAFHKSNQSGAKHLSSTHSGSRYAGSSQSVVRSSSSSQQASRHHSSSQSFMRSTSGHSAAQTATSGQSASRTGHSGHKHSLSRTSSRSHSSGSVSSKNSRSASISSASVADTEGSTLLEKFLLCSQPLNPNNGSDEVFPDQKVTEKISQLEINDNGNLLKQLLTGEIDNEHMQQYETSVIANRKYSDPAESSDSEESMTTDSLDQPDQTGQDLGFDLFDPSAAVDMDTLLAPLNSDVDMVMESNLNDILREQMRHEDLWMQEYFNNL